MSATDFIVNWLASTPVFAVPLVIAAMGLIVNERAGVLNLGAEGLLLCGALAGIGTYFTTGNNPWLGMLAAIAAGILVSALFGFMVVVLRTNQVVTGIALVFFASGLTSMLGVRGGWQNKAVGGFAKLDLGFLTDLPVVGKIVFAQDAIVYLTIPLIILVNRLLYRSVLGMKLRAVGENPQAADAAGISVDLYRFGAVLAGGALVGMAGGYLGLAASKIWLEDMTSGRGWIAIALVIFARWLPWRALFGALLFGGIEAVIPRISAAGIQVPQYFMLMTPYLATLVVLVYVGLVRRKGSDAPGALGLAYVREDRR
jgi:simple sugar transport system permease protein